MTDDLNDIETAEEMITYLETEFRDLVGGPFDPNPPRFDPENAEDREELKALLGELIPKIEELEDQDEHGRLKILRESFEHTLEELERAK